MLGQSVAQGVANTTLADTSGAQANSRLGAYAATYAGIGTSGLAYTYGPPAREVVGRTGNGGQWITVGPRP
jgi:hypothetical protein